MPPYEFRWPLWCSSTIHLPDKNDRVQNRWHRWLLKTWAQNKAIQFPSNTTITSRLESQAEVYWSHTTECYKHMHQWHLQVKHNKNDVIAFSCWHHIWHTAARRMRLCVFPPLWHEQPACLLLKCLESWRALVSTSNGLKSNSLSLRGMTNLRSGMVFLRHLAWRCWGLEWLKSQDLKWWVDHFRPSMCRPLRGSHFRPLVVGGIRDACRPPKTCDTRPKARCLVGLNSVELCSIHPLNNNYTIPMRVRSTLYTSTSNITRSLPPKKSSTREEHLSSNNSSSNNNNNNNNNHHHHQQQQQHGLAPVCSCKRGCLQIVH